MTLDDFVEKGTSTAMKKVVKLLQNSSASVDGSGKKRKAAPSAPDPKQRSISSFFKTTKKEA